MEHCSGHSHEGHNHSHGHDHNSVKSANMGHCHGHGGHDHSHECGEVSIAMEPPTIRAHGVDEDVARRKSVLRRLTTASLLCATLLIIEVVGGLIAGSLAVLSDAAHLFADLASFAVAIAAAYISSLPPSEKHTFGLKRTEALAALFSMVSLALISAGLAFEAIRRLWPIILTKFHGSTISPGAVDVDGKLMSLIAMIGVVVNLMLAFILGEHHTHLPGADHGHSHSYSHGHGHGHGHGPVNKSCENADEENTELILLSKESYGSELHHIDELALDSSDSCRSHSQEKEQRNINLHAAYLHVLGDLAQSVAVLIAGLIIWAYPNCAAADPVCTIFFAILVFYSTIGIIKSSISILLEEVPPSLSWFEIREAIASVRGVSNVHDLHIWSISHGEPALSVHVNAVHPGKALKEIHDVCLKHKIRHSTIQVQPSSVTECITCNDGMLQCR